MTRKKSKKKKQIIALLLTALLIFQNIEIGVANIADGDGSIDTIVEKVEESEIVETEESDMEGVNETDDFSGIDRVEKQEELQETSTNEMEILLDESIEMQKKDIIVQADLNGEVISGSCGESVTYVLNDEGILTISGNGDMKDWPYKWRHPWYNYYADIKKIVIKNGVTSIGNYEFFRCSSLSSVEIPSSVTHIGYGAFRGCSSLSSVEIPSSVTSIESDTFYNCSSLSSVKIPSGVTSIGDSAFYNCSSLSSVEIPSGVTSIGEGAFIGCSSLSSVKIPSGVTSIGDSAFYNCSSLSSVEIPSGVTSIGIHPICPICLIHPISPICPISPIRPICPICPIWPIPSPAHPLARQRAALSPARELQLALPHLKKCERGSAKSRPQAPFDFNLHNIPIFS